MPAFKICVTDESHLKYVDVICETIAASAAERGTGIAKRSPEYIAEKIREGKAVIALGNNDSFGGFCYIETWGHGRYVANSGLIVHSNFRHQGLAKKIKEKAFKLSRKKFPNSKIFGLTTSLAVMKINSDLGYSPVTFSELTDDKAFWKGCESCVNFQILESKNFQNCLCTGMQYDPNDNRSTRKWNFLKKSKIYERMVRIKRAVFKPKIKVLAFKIFSA